MLTILVANSVSKNCKTSCHTLTVEILCPCKRCRFRMTQNDSVVAFVLIHSFIHSSISLD
jgi:hypothetical protein